MKRGIVFHILLVYLLVAIGGRSAAAATPLNLVEIYRGWYDASGVGGPGSNYVVGDNRGNHPNDPDEAEYRNFFVFQLASVMSPIESATLALFLPAEPPGYMSKDPSETYELHDVSGVDNVINRMNGLAAHTDLGDGAVYGSRTITAAEMGTIIEIQLTPVAVAELNNSHGLFAIGGKLTTLDSLQNNEMVFAATHEGYPITELRLTLISEPNSLLLFSIAVMLAISRRRLK